MHKKSKGQILAIDDDVMVQETNKIKIKIKGQYSSKDQTQRNTTSNNRASCSSRYAFN